MRKVIKSFPRLPLEIFIWPKNFLWNIYYFQKEAKPTRNWWYPAHYRDRLVICQLIYDLIGLHLYVKAPTQPSWFRVWYILYNVNLDLQFLFHTFCLGGPWVNIDVFLNLNIYLVKLIPWKIDSFTRIHISDTKSGNPLTNI